MVPGEDQELREPADGLNDWFAPSSWILPPWMPTPSRRRFNQSTKRLRREVRDLLDDDLEATHPQDTGNQAGDSHSSHQAESQEPSRDSDDLLTRLQRASDTEDGGRITTDEIEDQLVTMVFAGHESTAAALAFTCIYWAHIQPPVIDFMRNWNRSSVASSRPMRIFPT